MKKILIVLSIVIISTQIYSQSYNDILIKNFTSGSAVDSLVFPFLSGNITIINDASETDTMFISNYSTFPDTLTFIRTGGEGLSYNITWEKLYYKFGSTPTAGKKGRIEVQSKNLVKPN